MSDATPTLPRFWWLKRIAAAYGIVALLLAALTATWSWRSSVALRSLQEEWRAEGAPATVDEINAMGPPFDARARDDGDRFRAAADALSKSPFPENDRRLRDRHENVDRRAPIAQRDIDLARRAAQFHAKPLATIESLLDEHADGQPIDFGTRFRTPMISVLLPHLNGLRSAGDSLNELARLRHAEGDHAAALATVQRLLTLTRQTCRPPALIVQFMSAQQVAGDACDAVEAIAGSLDVSGNGDGAARGGASTQPVAADRVAVQRLITALMDDVTWRDALRSALVVERVMIPDTVEHTIGLKEPAPLHRRAFRFGYRVGAERYFSVALRALAAPDRVAAQAAGWPPETDPAPQPQPRRPTTPPPKRSRLMAGTRIIAEYLYPYLRSNVWGAFELATRRHACATLLAIRLFELDHGRVPTTLDELVPTYLPEVPRDLTRAGAPPLTYVNDNGIVGIWISDPRHPTSRPATQPTDFRPGGRTRQHLMVVYRGHERWRNLATGSARR